MTDPDHARPEPGSDATTADIEADIEATRNELGQTVDALTSKLDVKAQAKERVEDAKRDIAEKAERVRSKGSEIGSQAVNAATDDHGSVRPVVPAAAIALIAVIVGIVVWRRRR